MTKYHLQAVLAVSVVLMFIVIGCEAPEPAAEQEIVEEVPAEEVESPLADVESAVAVIHPTEGYDVHGTVMFTEQADGILIEAQLMGLEPGEHGFHVHTYGDCTAEDLSSAGGHFNPEDQPHGAPTDEMRHVGDFGNITANQEGVATYSRVDELISFTGEHSIIGRAVIIHGGADDLESQPSGAAGPRIGCGVIGIANPETALDVAAE